MIFHNHQWQRKNKLHWSCILVVSQIYAPWFKSHYMLTRDLVTAGFSCSHMGFVSLLYLCTHLHFQRIILVWIFIPCSGLFSVHPFLGCIGQWHFVWALFSCYTFVVPTRLWKHSCMTNDSIVWIVYSMPFIGWMIPF